MVGVDPHTSLTGKADLEAEALIEEARARQRRRRRSLVLVSSLAVAVGLLVYAVVALTSGTSSRTTSPNGPVAAQAFAGTWHVHTYYLVIKADGNGSANWPTHIPCGSAGAPRTQACDRSVPGTTVLANGQVIPVEEVVDGGHADIVLTFVKGDSARGQIENSTVQSTLPDGPVTFRLAKNDLLYVKPSRPTVGSPFGNNPLCGPKASQLSVSQQEAEGINCGA